MSNTQAELKMIPNAPEPLLVEGEDFYREGAAIVFTARYHLRRGYCCESGCRHCPYRAAARAEEQVDVDQLETN